MQKIDRVVKYAKENYFRLLVQVNPDFQTIHVFCDQEHYNFIARSILNNDIDVAVKWILTDEQIIYPEKNVEILKENKGKLTTRFLRNIKVDRNWNGEIMICFVPVGDDFTKNEKQDLLSNIASFGKEKLDSFITNFSMMAESTRCKINRVGEHKLCVYKF